MNRNDHILRIRSCDVGGRDDITLNGSRCRRRSRNDTAVQIDRQSKRKRRTYRVLTDGSTAHSRGIRDDRETDGELCRIDGIMQAVRRAEHGQSDQLLDEAGRVGPGDRVVGGNRIDRGYSADDTRRGAEVQTGGKRRSDSIGDHLSPAM